MSFHRAQHVRGESLSLISAVIVPVSRCPQKLIMFCFQGSSLAAFLDVEIWRFLCNLNSQGSKKDNVGL